MHRGKSRIKVTQTGCLGACRFRKAALFYTNTMSNQPVNNSLWVRRIQKLDDTQWNKVFDCLASDKSVLDYLGEDHHIPMEELE